MTEFVHPLATLGVTRAEAESAAEVALPPVYLSGSGIIFGFQGGWWRIDQLHCVELTALAIAPGANLDTPRVATVGEHGVSVDWGHVPDSSAVSAVVFGNEGGVAVSEDGVHWRPFIQRQPTAVIVIEEGCSVLALVVDNGEPKLVTLSSAGRIVRLVGTHGVTTLTRWSGGPGRPTIHPSLPLVAVQRADDLVEVGHLLTGELHQVIRSEA